MDLPVMPPVSPMLAAIGRELPAGEGFLYEPKWDGFRAIIFRDGDEVEIGSRNERPLTRYFPEVLEAAREHLPARCVVDGEIVIAGPRGLEFDALLQRIHPAASRIRKLAGETPASFVAFDLLALDDRDLRALPLSERRALLEEALRGARGPVRLTPATLDRDVARDWFRRFEGAGLDGVIAKPLTLPYRAGERVMLKLKHERTADCVIGGFRWHKDGKGVGSLLLGLYDERGTLHHVGVASAFSVKERLAWVERLAPLREDALQGHPWKDWAEDAGEGPTRMPGGPSRWTQKKDMRWEAVRPERVVEVAYDHLQGARFRHATRFLRERPDRDPRSCTYAQLESVPPEELAQVFGAAATEPRPPG